MREGLEREPQNLAPCNDLADYFLDHRLLDKAMEYYAMVVDRGDQRNAEWAEPSLIYCRWLDSGDPAELERLVLCAASRPQSQRGAQLCEQAQLGRHREDDPQLYRQGHRRRGQAGA